MSSHNLPRKSLAPLPAVTYLFHDSSGGTRIPIKGRTMAIPQYFHVEASGDALVLSTVSNIDGLYEDGIYEECEALLNEVAQRQAKHTVIDLGSLDYFGSLMLHLLVVLWKRVDAGGGKLVVCNVSSVGNQVLKAAKLDSIWTILPSREAALAAVNG